MEVIKRAAAIATGLNFYFTGKPCNKGHFSERRVSTRQCVGCERDYAQQNRDGLVIYHKNYYAANRTGLLAKQKIYHDARSTLRAARMRVYYRENHAARVAAGIRWKSENRDSVAASNLRRIARKRRAVPVWFGEFDEFVWLEAAHLCGLRFAATGLNWASDHMIPLASRIACGLHVAENCQVIPQSLNSSKNNRMRMTNKFEWLLEI